MPQSSLRLKTRIKTSKNISQITRAMEMVSASKMRRAQQRAINGAPFSTELANVLLRLTSQIDRSAHPLLQQPISGREVFILISTDRGLAGSLNTNIFTFTNRLLNKRGITNPLFITVGKKARDFVVRSGYELLASFIDLPARIKAEDLSALNQLIISSYLQNDWLTVDVIYSDFISTLVQKPKVINLLPFGTPEVPDMVEPLNNSNLVEYKFEPEANQILDWLLPYYLENRLYQIYLESLASEHSARMVAMKNAREAANDLVQGLTLVYNQARQAKVTSELLDAYAARITLS